MSAEKKALNSFCERILLNPMSDPWELSWARNKLAELHAERVEPNKRA